MLSQPQPSRSWVRLGSMTRPALPTTPAAAPPPTPPPTTTPLLRPSLSFLTSVRPAGAEPLPGPPPPVQTTSTAPMPKEPTASAPPPASVVEIPISLKDIKTINETTPRSPRQKPGPSLPLSPLKLPPQQIKSPNEDVLPRIQLEAEQKNILFQKVTTIPEHKPGDKDMIPSGRAHKPCNAAAVGKGALDGDAGMVKKKKEAGHKGIKLIVMAGENRGATMELTRDVTKKGNQASSGSSNEGKHGTEDRVHKGKAREMVVYKNINVQGVNNSILYNSCCNHCDPRVQSDDDG